MFTSCDLGLNIKWSVLMLQSFRVSSSVLIKQFVKKKPYYCESGITCRQVDWQGENVQNWVKEFCPDVFGPLCGRVTWPWPGWWQGDSHHLWQHGWPVALEDGRGHWWADYGPPTGSNADRTRATQKQTLWFITSVNLYFVKFIKFIEASIWQS